MLPHRAVNRHFAQQQFGLLFHQGQQTLQPIHRVKERENFLLVLKPHQNVRGNKIGKGAGVIQQHHLFFQVGREGRDALHHMGQRVFCLPQHRLAHNAAEFRADDFLAGHLCGVVVGKAAQVFQFRALIAVAQDVHGAVLVLDRLLDFGNGAHFLKIGKFRRAVHGFCQGYQQHKRVGFPRRVRRGKRRVVADLKLNRNFRKRHHAKQRDDGKL